MFTLRKVVRFCFRNQKFSDAQFSVAALDVTQCFDEDTEARQKGLARTRKADPSAGRMARH